MMGGGNMQQLARQAQKLQQQMTKKQEESPKQWIPTMWRCCRIWSWRR